MNIKEQARGMAEALSKNKAFDITLINIAEKSSFADFFVNATAGSERQLNALKEAVEEYAFSIGLEAKSIEGKQGSGWTLIDYGDVVVNIFSSEMRDKYSLDKIWGDCEIIHIGE